MPVIWNIDENTQINLYSFVKHDIVDNSDEIDKNLQLNNENLLVKSTFTVILFLLISF